MGMVTGVVEAKNHNAKYGTYGILVNGGWYNSKYEIRAEKGDEVEFDDGGKNYVRKCKVLGAGGGASTSGGASTGTVVSRQPGFPVPVDTKDRSIVRQNALRHAVVLVTNMVGPQEYDSWSDRETAMENFAKLAVEVARMFEDYTAGDSEGAEAAAMLDS